MKKSPRQVRLDDDIEGEIKKIAGVTDLPIVEIIRQTVKAGVLAIKENDYKLPLPLRLKVLESAPKNSSSSSSVPPREQPADAAVKQGVAAQQKKKAG